MCVAGRCGEDSEEMIFRWIRTIACWCVLLRRACQHLRVLRSNIPQGFAPPLPRYGLKMVGRTPCTLVERSETSPREGQLGKNHRRRYRDESSMRIPGPCVRSDRI
jgi:hypothetical protein